MRTIVESMIKSIEDKWIMSKCRNSPLNVLDVWYTTYVFLICRVQAHASAMTHLSQSVLSFEMSVTFYHLQLEGNFLFRKISIIIYFIAFWPGEKKFLGEGKNLLLATWESIDNENFDLHMVFMIFFDWKMLE